MAKRYSNFTLHTIDGICGAAGMSFVAAETILPGMLKQLSAPAWMITLAPALVLFGSALPAALVVPVINRLPRKKEFILRWGTTLQRGPYFLLLPLMLLVSDQRILAWLIFLATFAIGLGVGNAVPPWIRLLAKTVAPSQIPRLIALRFLFGGVFGFAGGMFVVKNVLARWPDRFGYAILFACASFFFALSIYFFARIREPAESPERLAEFESGNASYLELFRNRDILNFQLGRIFYCGIFFAAGLLPVQFCRELNLSEGYLGVFAALVVAGAVCGNFFIVRWTRRHTSRSALLIGLGVYFVIFAGALWRGSLIWAMMLFFLLGFARDVWNSAEWSLMVTLPERRLHNKNSAMTMMVMAPPILLAGFGGGALYSATGSFSLLSAIAALLLLPAIYFSWRLPRGANRR
jgi:MFS family permease